MNRPQTAPNKVKIKKEINIITRQGRYESKCEDGWDRATKGDKVSVKILRKTKKKKSKLNLIKEILPNKLNTIILPMSK